MSKHSQASASGDRLLHRLCASLEHKENKHLRCRSLSTHRKGGTRSTRHARPTARCQATATGARKPSYPDLESRDLNLTLVGIPPISRAPANGLGHAACRLIQRIGAPSREGSRPASRSVAHRAGIDRTRRRARSQRVLLRSRSVARPRRRPTPPRPPGCLTPNLGLAPRTSLRSPQS